MKKYISELKNRLIKNLTSLRGNSENPKTREVSTPPIREVKSNKPIADSLNCPYCFSLNFQKRGFRQKKHEKIQLYLCLSCGKTFTPNQTKGKHYPLKIMLDAISIYNLGYSLEQTCGIINSRYKIRLQPSTLSTWLDEVENLCRFSRMRKYAMKKYLPKDMVVTATLAHRQLYRYRFHRAKCALIIGDDFKHRRFGPLQEFLEMVPGECPHQYFQQGLRASMIVRGKQNYATRLGAFALQSVTDRKQRHEAIQKFMLANDSVTVATEVPIYITRDDLEHMQSQLGFEMYQKSAETAPEGKEISAADGLPRLITGHIDLVQIRNGQIHILDYKGNAEKERPIEQLTLYAMALSRLTGLRLFEFKCAWFDEKDYFEFYPLHVLHKPNKNRRRRKVYTMEGIYDINKDDKKILSVRPVIT